MKYSFYYILSWVVKSIFYISLLGALHQRPGTGEAGQTDAATEPREEIQREILFKFRLNTLLSKELKEFRGIGALADRVETVTHFLGVRGPLRRADRLLSVHNDVNLVVHAVADTLHVPEGTRPFWEILQADNGSLFLPHATLVLILQDLSAILFARSIVVHLDRLRETEVGEKIRLHGGELHHCAVALKLEHWEDLLVASSDGGLLVAVGGAYTKDTIPLGVLEQLVLEPHLPCLRKRPHTAVVFKLGNGVGVLAGSEDREAGLRGNFLEPALDKELTELQNQFVVNLGVSHLEDSNYENILWISGKRKNVNLKFYTGFVETI